MRRLAVAFVLLNCVDLAMTYYFVESGVASELNPVMSWALRLPVLSLLMFKILLPVVLVAAVLTLGNNHSFTRINWCLVLQLLVLGEALVCLWNGLVVLLTQ